MTRSGMTLRGFTFALTAMSGVIWMGTSIFIPGLPHIGRDLGMDSSQLSNLLLLYCLSFAVVMLIAGPLSDAWGRRNFILAGLGLFALGGVGCATASEMSILYTGRVIQGMGVGMVQVPTLAMVKDECEGSTAYAVLGLLGALTGIIPVLSMLLGGIVIEALGWRPVFYILAGTSAVSAAVCLSMPETLPPGKRLARIDMRQTLGLYMDIMLSKQMLLVTSPLLLLALFQGVYLVIAPISLEKDFGLSPTLFAVANVMVVLGMAAGQYLATRAVKRYNPKTLYIVGALPALAGGVLFAALALTSSMEHAVTFMFPLTLLAFAFGFMEPIGLKSLFSQFEKTSGMASASYVSLLLVLQGSGSLIAGLLLDASLSPPIAMALIIAPLGIIIATVAKAGQQRIL